MRDKPFVRETRYIVVKIKDALGSLTLEERDTLAALSAKAASYGSARRKTTARPRRYLVIEDDWPEYEPTWKEIEARVSGEGRGD